MTTNAVRRRPWSVWVVVALMIILALGALPVGWSMVTDPSGAGMGMSTDWLKPPFESYFLPGIFLLLGMGAANLFAAALLLLRPQWGWAERLNPFNSQEWPWTLAMAMGVFVMVWIAVQVVSVTLYSFLQPAVFIAGLLIFTLMWLPTTRRAYAV